MRSLKLNKGIEGLSTFPKWIGQTKTLHQTKLFSCATKLKLWSLEIDEERRRISFLGMKQCKANPWDDFSLNFKKKATKLKARSSLSLTSRVHWLDRQHRWFCTCLICLGNEEEAVCKFKKGDIEAIVLAIDGNVNRVSPRRKTIGR